MINLIKCEFIKNYSIKKIIFIIIFLVISLLLLIKKEEVYNYGITVSVSNMYSKINFNSSYRNAKVKYSDNNNFINEDILNIFNDLEDTYNHIDKNINMNKDIWQKNAIDILIGKLSRKYAIKRINCTDSNDILKYTSNYETIYSSDSDLYRYIKNNYMEFLSEDSGSVSLITLNNLDDEINELENALKSNKYYMYVDYNYKNSFKYTSIRGVKIDNKYSESVKYIIDNKIEDEDDFRAINAYNYYSFVYVKNFINFSDNDRYKPQDKYNENIRRILKDEERIVDYSFKNEVKNDLEYVIRYNFKKYVNSKNYMNRGLSLGFFVLIILIISNSGIISREHDRGTIKLLLTKPIKRDKILLSKFLYLILDMYFIWIIGLIILFFICGIKFGFYDLFTPKIIILFGKVTSINYLLWYIVSLIICSIPIIFMLSFMFMLSSTIKSGALTSTITSIISVFSFLYFILFELFNLDILKYYCYLPFSYINYNIIIENSDSYIKGISYTNLSNYYGIIICIIFTIINLVFSINYYKKIDIINK